MLSQVRSNFPHVIMFLDMSDEELERLLRLAALGERVTNDWTREDRWSLDQRRNAELLSYLCERASTTPADFLAERHPDGTWIPSKELEDDTDRLLMEYDEELFWDELILRLARRDLVAEYGVDALQHLSPEHRRRAEDAMIRYYEKEVDDRGIERLKVEGEKKAGAISRKLRHNPGDASS